MSASGAVVVAALATVLLSGCGGGAPTGGRDRPVASASPLARALGQSCSWQHGLTVTVDGVRRTSGSDATRYSVAVRLSNRTVMSYATDGLSVQLRVGPHGQVSRDTRSAESGNGFATKVLASGAAATGRYGFTLPAVNGSDRPSDRVAVWVQPSPVDQPCLFQGSASRT